MHPTRKSILIGVQVYSINERELKKRPFHTFPGGRKWLRRFGECSRPAHSCGWPSCCFLVPRPRKCGSVTVNVGAADSVPPGKLGTVGLFADATAPEDGYEGATYSAPTWFWYATGASGLNVDMTASAQNPTLNATIPASGTYSIFVKAIVTWTKSTGGTVSEAGEITFDLPVVGVAKLQSMPDNFEGRDLDYYGVCELIDLSFQTVPTGISAYNIGELKWGITSGGGVLTDKGDGTGIYECADVADEVTLELELTMFAQKKGPPPKGIVPPNAHAMMQAPESGFWHEKGKQGCIALLLFWSKGPKNVSFAQIQCQEGESAGITGTGLFAAVDGNIHPPMNDGKGNPVWADLLKIDGFDGFLWTAKDECGTKNNGAFEDGYYEDAIYMMYRKKLDPKLANADTGQWYANCKTYREAEEVNGVMKVWKDPVPLRASGRNTVSMYYSPRKASTRRNIPGKPPQNPWVG
jgi:hypothetical protein